MATVVNDADRLLQEVREAREKLVGDGPEDKALCGAAEPLSQVLRQDIERREAGPQLRDGVAKDRMPSVHDPEMRHGHKSANKRFDGHKAQIAVDTESQIITAVDALAGNAPDNEGALALVKASEKNSGLDVAETVADCAFGDGETRAAFAEDQRLLVAKVPAMRNKGRFPKTNFIIDLEVQSCLCPAGQSGVARYHKLDKEKEGPQEKQLRSFQFAAATCAACPLRPQCTTGQGGRSIQVHPREAMIQAARAFQKSPDFHAYKVARQAVEHRLARLVQLGIRQARYVGRPKTLFQLLMAATVANLTRIAGLDAASSGQSGLQTGPSLALIVLWVAAAALLAAPSHRYPRSIPFPNPLGSATPRFLPPAKTAPSWPRF